LIDLIPIGVVMLTSVLLFFFGVNLLFLTWRASRLSPDPDPSRIETGEPEVCVQLPIYNERYVAERVLDAVCGLDWPRDRLEVQVLDDSDDDTTAIVERRAAQLRRRGFRVSHVRRGTRTGYKAGALAHGMTLTAAPFIAIFDADFVPPADFLRRTIAAFERPEIGFAQARWGHLDEGYSWFTRLQALAIDYHFLIEQAARAAGGYFTNFTGTAGVWRRAAIEDSGGWSAATLTEDLDLSYRAQLRGWKASYLEDLVVPEELPVSIDAYRSQQSRWATGSFQSAFKLLGPVVRSRARAAVKLQAAIHLLAYGIGPLMLVQLACYPLLLVAFGRHGLRLPWYVTAATAVAVLVSLAPWIGFVVAQTRRGRRWWSGLPSLACQVVGTGMTVNTMAALFRASRPGGVFVRTPKHRIVKRGQEWRDQAYVHTGDPRALLEAGFGAAALAIVPFAVASGQGLIAVYALVFGSGFLVVAGLSAVEFLEVLTLRRLGREALSRARAAAPTAALLGFASLLLLLAAHMPEPFEDGYGHWLIAANLAATGSLHDPLFAMEDTWLPAYHLLAAGVLRVFGLWQIGALKALGAGLGLTILVFVYRLAPSRGQGRLAVVLLVLNPVFLFTSGSAVVEPLLTMLLTGAALAAVKKRMKVAAVLAALACTTSTKAWIWIAVAAAVALLETLRTRAPARARIPAVAWAVPAVGALIFLQLGYAPASHSIARGSMELMSATARGSVPAGTLGRLGEITGTLGLAALPLFAFGLIGLVQAWRQKASRLLTFIYIPAAVYLAAVGGLVAIGVYTGSHRYLYPVLPALALLAAGALGRYAFAVRAVVLAIAALLVVAFLPVFASFAAGNAGLIAAGRSAAGSPGLLLTDSPVAAFYSGKAPEQITGSRSLPPDRAAALEWMQSRGVSVLVLENISYYRAVTVFPDLAAGHAGPPFAQLGDQSRYRTTGGKAVYAYRFGTGLALQSIAPGLDAAVAPSTAEGKTAPLAKGVTLTAGGFDATGEGMGFGVPIVRYQDGWVYPRTVSFTDLSTGEQTVWQKTFQLDEIGGDAARAYRFDPIPSRGAVEVTYLIDGGGMTITVKPLWLAPGFSQVGILNEQSAAFADFAADGQAGPLIGPKFGSWVPVTGSWARLRSQALGVEWSLPALPGSELHGGRELLKPDFNWAGLDYIFTAPFAGTTYRITVQEAR
jgi:cellulose synthase/poly-beta-1,6-N-acetylglucosamine synthase-like glycosyltransferase